MIEFFLPMVPPTITLQEHRLGISQKGAPYVYDPPELKEARMKFAAALVNAKAKHGPADRIAGPVRLTTRWCWPIPEGSGRRNGEYKTTRPDTDNVLKLFKDCMTRTGFWKDDAQVVSELTEKFWAAIPGVFVRIEPL